MKVSQHNQKSELLLNVSVKLLTMLIHDVDHCQGSDLPRIRSRFDGVSKGTELLFVSFSCQHYENFGKIREIPLLSTFFSSDY